MRSIRNNNLTDSSQLGINGTGAFPFVNRKDSPKIVGDFSSVALGTLGVITKRLYLIPFQTPKKIILSNLRVNVTTVSSGTSCEIGIYNNILLSNGNDNPNKLIASVTNVPLTTTGDKTSPINFTFNEDILYWIGIICLGAPTLRALTVSSMAPTMGRVSASNNANTHLYKNLTVSNLPTVAPTDLTISTGSIPAIYLVE